MFIVHCDVTSALTDVWVTGAVPVCGGSVPTSATALCRYEGPVGVGMTVVWV